MKMQIEGMNVVKGLICYCFEYSVDDINQDYLKNKLLVSILNLIHNQTTMF